MFSNITSSIVALLEETGLNAGRNYPREAIRRGECTVRAGIEAVRQSEAGFFGFLGIETDGEGNEKECYGMKCEAELKLDIYAPMDLANAAEECEKTVDELIFALGKWEGLKIRAFSCSGAKPDGETGMFLCPCRAELGLLLTLEAEDEAAQFSDFILKGEIKK